MKIRAAKIVVAIAAFFQRKPPRCPRQYGANSRASCRQMPDVPARQRAARHSLALSSRTGHRASMLVLEERCRKDCGQSSPANDGSNGRACRCAARATAQEDRTALRFRRPCRVLASDRRAGCKANASPGRACSGCSERSRNGPRSAARTTNMLAPAAVTRWPDPTSAVNPAANPPAAPADQNAEARAAPTPPAKPQVMPRAVPPVPVSEKPMSLPMLITIVAGGLSVLAVMVSTLFAWLAARKARLSPSAAMPPLEMPDHPRRPGDPTGGESRCARKATSDRHAA